MPTERIAMRKVREILRLTYDGGLPSREVGRQSGRRQHGRPRDAAAFPGIEA